jgi:hypothetical protein
MPTLARVTIPNKNGLAVDAVVNTFAFDVDATDTAKQADVFTAVAGFYDGNNAVSGENVIESIAASHDVIHPLVELYDLTSHLDGSNLGSPVATAAPTWARLGSRSTAAAGGQLAACIVFHADYDVPEVGASGSIPSTDEAQDQGAPATHTGVTRPRARERGRIYIGPLNQGDTTTDTNGNPLLTAGVAGTLQAASVALMAQPVSWSVWSRRDSQLRHVTHGWVDLGIKTQRGREFRPNTRNNW